MKCSEFEIRLCEFLDGTLEETSRREMEQHASECELCAALVADSRAVQGFLERVEPVEAPQELVTSILYRTRHARSSVWPAIGWRRWLQPLLQPRFAMSMAMTILSVSMLYRVAGVQIRQLEAADLNPIQIWHGVDNSAHRLWNRGVKFYQNARFIYEIVQQWRALDSEEEQGAEAAAGSPPPEPRKLEPSPPPARKK
ncbi:MAG: zf-HC2 domain-containing protein [Acidobacteria bacterium]|nr:zf-HC2 domain-containing protein [Acidobacteriota bacterium]